MNSIKPISPDEIIEAKKDYIPEFVIEVVNKLIAKYWDGTSACINQNELIEEISKNSGDMHTRSDVFKKRWLDFEDIYRNVGWDVKYEKPMYYENFEPTFLFTKNTK